MAKSKRSRSSAGKPAGKHSKAADRSINTNNVVSNEKNIGNGSKDVISIKDSEKPKGTTSAPVPAPTAASTFNVAPPPPDSDITPAMRDYIESLVARANKAEEECKKEKEKRIEAEELLNEFIVDKLKDLVNDQGIDNRAMLEDTLFRATGVSNGGWELQELCRKADEADSSSKLHALDNYHAKGTFNQYAHERTAESIAKRICFTELELVKNHPLFTDAHRRMAETTKHRFNELQCCRTTEEFMQLMNNCRDASSPNASLRVPKILIFKGSTNRLPVEGPATIRKMYSNPKLKKPAKDLSGNWRPKVQIAQKPSYSPDFCGPPTTMFKSSTTPVITV
ncbi:hypothetical protein BJ508DRAFT_330605 [Ascobolus immersus RN42]|uniref:Uncharacterized protein n=1 Tax=Ascobolus immersus RN42 TaxID=1160509 RepID=A0A3N4HSY1_ASCIM|nr:hypothetical protein BJ508DRAFT_330605 [Ascobolus immersus RN42]